VDICGKTGERANGNGSLMRTLPVCLYYAEKTQTGEATVGQAIRDIHKISALTHNHLRACMTCGLYFFCVREMIFGEGSLNERLQRGMDQGFAYYEKDIANLGDDTDTVGAIAGGLAGLYYGYDAIPEEWREALIKREWIEEMCVKEEGSFRCSRAT